MEDGNTFQMLCDKLEADKCFLLQQKNNASHHLLKFQDDNATAKAHAVFGHAASIISCLDANPVNTSPSFLNDFFMYFDDSLLDSNTSTSIGHFFTPVQGDAKPAKKLESDENTLGTIFWASRDGYSNIYIKFSGSDGWELLEIHNRLYSTHMTFGAMLGSISPYVDFTHDDLLTSTLTYHSEPLPLLTTDGLKPIKTEELNDPRSYLNPAGGAYFDLYWDHLEALIPMGGTRFLYRKMPALGLDKCFKQNLSQTISNGVIQQTLLLNRDQFDQSSGRDTKRDELESILTGYFQKVQQLLPNDINMIKFDGWFNSLLFREIIGNTEFHDALPAQANEITIWNRILSNKDLPNGGK